MSHVLYSELAKYYDLIVQKDTRRECGFLVNVFEKYGQGIKTVLDLGCGTGRHAKILSEKGFKVTGIDLSEELLAVAREKCPRAEFLKMDFRELHFEKTFDAVIFMWTTFSYLKEEELKKFVSSIYRYVDQLLILDSTNFFNPKERDPSTKSRVKVSENEEVRIVQKVNALFEGNFRTLSSKYDILNKLTGERKELQDEHVAQMYSLDELGKFLEGKFEIVGAFGDYDLTSVYESKTSERMISVWKKGSENLT